MRCCVSRECEEQPKHVTSSDSGKLGAWLEERLGIMTDAARFRRHALIKDHWGGSLKDFYLLSGSLGKGGFGVVKKAYLKGCPGIVRAVKAVRKRPEDPQFNFEMRKETLILRMLDHPNVCRIHEVFETSNHLCLVMEFIEGRELFYEIQENITR